MHNSQTKLQNVLKIWKQAHIVPADSERVQEGTIKWDPYVWMCVVNIVNLPVDWPPLLHTLTDRDLGQDDHWPGVPTNVT